MSEIKLEYIPLSEIREYERNSRTHSQEQIEQLKRSIVEYGFTNPVLVDENNVLIAGHGRTRAARCLGFKEVPAVRLTGLTEAKKKALRIADNQLALNAGWDEESLKIELEGLKAEDYDLDLTGFSDDELKIYFDEHTDTKKEITEDEIPCESSVQKRCEKGDIWELGKHRLMCGDSTNRDDVARLMGGQKADVAFTSPPYNVSLGYSVSNPDQIYGQGDGLYRDYNDGKSVEDYLQLLSKALENCLEFADDVLYNIGYCKGALKATALLLGKFSDQFGGAIIWEKNNAFVPLFDSQFGILANVCEPIYFFNSNGFRKFSHPTWDKTTPSYNAIKTCCASKNEYAKEHNATFPVELPAEVLKRFTHDSILDVFGGTGTTLIAAEQLGRKCYMMEQSSHYCDIVIERWEKLTGERAVKLQ